MDTTDLMVMRLQDVEGVAGNQGAKCSHFHRKELLVNKIKL